MAVNSQSPFRSYLGDAHAALIGGDAGECERRAKAISALVRAERDVAEFLTEQRAAEQDDDDTVREELERRLALLAEAEHAGASPETLARIVQTGA